MSSFRFSVAVIARARRTAEPFGDRSDELSGTVMARAQTTGEPFGISSNEPFPDCHREERSRFDRLKAPSLSRGDVAIHLEKLGGLPQSACLLRNDKQVFISISEALRLCRMFGLPGFNPEARFLAGLAMRRKS